MKTSNYIIISFFVCLFGGIFALFLAAKIDPRGSSHYEIITQEKVLDNFTVVVAESGSNIKLYTAESSKMVLNYSKEDTCSFPSFTIKDDTLFISSNPPGNKYYQTEILCKQIKSIDGKEKSQINLERTISDTLFIKLNKSNFRYFPGKNSTDISFNLIATESEIQIGDANIANLNMNLHRTKMDAWGSHIKNLSGKLHEETRLSLGQIDKINIEADSTSTYRLNN